MTAPPVFTFEVIPSGDTFAPLFEAFLLDVPSLSGEGFAARRAYWSAFHKLGAAGIEPEEFQVNSYPNSRPIGPGSYIEKSSA